MHQRKHKKRRGKVDRWLAELAPKHECVPKDLPHFGPTFTFRQTFDAAVIVSSEADHQNTKMSWWEVVDREVRTQIDRLRESLVRSL